MTSVSTERTLQTVEREILNLTKAIAAGGELEPLLVELRARPARRDELLAAHESVKVLLRLADCSLKQPAYQRNW